MVCKRHNELRCVFVWVYALSMGAMVTHQEGSGMNTAVFHLHVTILLLFVVNLNKQIEQYGRKKRQT